MKKYNEINKISSGTTLLWWSVCSSNLQKEKKKKKNIIPDYINAEIHHTKVYTFDEKRQHWAFARYHEQVWDTSGERKLKQSGHANSFFFR